MIAAHQNGALYRNGDGHIHPVALINNDRAFIPPPFEVILWWEGVHNGDKYIELLSFLK